MWTPKNKEVLPVYTGGLWTPRIASSGCPLLCCILCQTLLTCSTGSMADVPKDLLQEIKRLEDLFTVDTAKLKAITDHFVSELAKGNQDYTRDRERG